MARPPGIRGARRRPGADTRAASAPPPWFGTPGTCRVDFGGSELRLYGEAGRIRAHALPGLHAAPGRYEFGAADLDGMTGGTADDEGDHAP